MTDQEEALIMRVKLLEREIQELTRQNYNLMIRISELSDQMRKSGSSLDTLTKV